MQPNEREVVELAFQICGCKESGYKECLCGDEEREDYIKTAKAVIKLGWHRPSPESQPAKSELVELNNEIINRCNEYAEDLKIVKTQVEIWNQGNQQRMHGQKCLIGATIELLESIPKFGQPAKAIVFPEKYNLAPKYTGNKLPEENSRDIQFQYGYNSALDEIRAMNEGRV